MTASSVLSALLLFGLLGLLGQGIRAVVGLKNAGSLNSATPSQQSVFSAAYLLVSLMIGFIAGVLAGIALKFQNIAQIDANSWKELLGIIGSGYIGADFVENTMNLVIPGTTQSPPPPSQAQQPLLFIPPAASASDLSDVRAQISGMASQVNQIHTSLLVAHPPAPSTPQVADWTNNMAIALSYRNAIAQASQTYSIPPSLICAIAWRESGWGQSKLMKPKGPGGTGDWAPRQGRMPPDGLGWGRGLMQIDYASHTAFCADPSEWQDPTKNISYGCDIFYGYRKQIQADISGISTSDLLRASVAAYNAGAGAAVKAIRAGNDVSKITYSPGYVDDIIAAMNWFQTQGFDSRATT